MDMIPLASGTNNTACFFALNTSCYFQINSFSKNTIIQHTFQNSSDPSDPQRTLSHWKNKKTIWFTFLRANPLTKFYHFFWDLSNKPPKLQLLHYAPTNFQKWKTKIIPLLHIYYWNTFHLSKFLLIESKLLKTTPISFQQNFTFWLQPQTLSHLSSNLKI